MLQRKEAIIYETSLREGMQTPGGIGGNIEERIYAANLISRFADYMELGMPANDVEYAMISRIRDSLSANSRDVGIAVLCRNSEVDISRAAQVLEGYFKTCAHLFIGTSNQHRKVRFGGSWKADDYVRNISESMESAASKPFNEIMFSPEDSYRTFMQSPDTFFMFVDAAIEGYAKGRKKLGMEVGIPVLNFPDTVGYSTIGEFNAMLDKINERYGKSIAISVHCHDDSHMSTAQAVEVYMTGRANWLQTTFARLGERDGIASTEEVIAILDERGLLDGKKFAKDEHRKLLSPTAHAVLASFGRRVPDETGISGSRVQISTAGIHTGVAQVDAETYHIFKGRYGSEPRMEFGPTSGADQIMHILKSVGIADDKKSVKVAEFTTNLKQRCNDEKRFLDETDIKYMAIKHFHRMSDPLSIMDYSVGFSRSGPTTVKVSGEFSGNAFSVEATENGGVEAIVAALQKVMPGRKIELADFNTYLVPMVPKEYLVWNTGEFPKPFVDVNIASKLRTNVRIRTQNGSPNSFEEFAGHACKENSLQPMIDATIDAIVKMALIKQWEAKQIKA